MAGTAFMQLIHLTERPEQDPCRAEGPLDQAIGAPGLGAAPQVGGGRTGQLRGTLCPDPGSVGAARAGSTAKRNGLLHRAIELAEEHQLPLIAAAAHEEAATLYAKTGRPRLHQHMLRSAYQRFLSQGMTLRTDRLAHANIRG